MILRRQLCRLLTLLRVHRQDCVYCHDLDRCWGDDMRKRLVALREEESPVAIQEQSEAEPAAASPSKRTGTDA